LSSLSNGVKQEEAMENYSWLLGSWLHLGDLRWVDAILALAAIACGLMIGGERQRREKPAGLRTLSLVCLGSAVFTMMSFAFTTTTGDSGRVAAQIVTGIGFLGAGVILHGSRIVTGVTTAAVIWVAAAIGMTVGAGYVVSGLALSLLVNRVLVVIFLYETRWHRDLNDACVVIEFAPNRGITRVRLESILGDYPVLPNGVHWEEISSELGRLTFRVRIARIHLNDLLFEMTEQKAVLSIAREKCERVFPAAKS
jgi:putative Mg2+ transporter-C (MgtC) family protein